MRPIVFRRAYAIALNESWAEGLLTLPQLRMARKPLRIVPRATRRAVIDLMAEIQEATYKGLEAQGLGVSVYSIIMWIKDHWKDILAILARLLPLILI